MIGSLRVIVSILREGLCEFMIIFR